MNFTYLKAKKIYQSGYPIKILLLLNIYQKIIKANQYADEAQEAKKTGKPHNIGAILFFFPGYGVTLKNIEDASKAARDRALHLNKLKEKKGC